MGNGKEELIRQICQEESKPRIKKVKQYIFLLKTMRPEKKEKEDN